MPFHEDMTVFFADFGSLATWNGLSGHVLFDAPEQIIGAAGDVITAEFRILYATGMFPGLKFKDTIYVNGTAYRVITVQAVDDGQLTQALLSKP